MSDLLWRVRLVLGFTAMFIVSFGLLGATFAAAFWMLAHDRLILTLLFGVVGPIAVLWLSAQLARPIAWLTTVGMPREAA